MEVKDNKLNLKNDGFSFENKINQQADFNIEIWQKEIEERNSTLPYAKRTKLAKCVDCGKFTEVNVCTLDKDVRCPECRKIHKAEIFRNNRDKQKEKYKYEGPFICLTCGKEFEEDWRKDVKSLKQGPPKFCCQTCSNIYASNNLDRSKTKILICPECGKEFEAFISAPAGITCCPECRKKITSMRGSFYRYRDNGYTGTIEDFKLLYFTEIYSGNKVSSKRRKYL